MKNFLDVLEKYIKKEEEIKNIKKNIQDVIFLHTGIFLETKDLYLKKESLYIESSSLKKIKILQKKDKILHDFKKEKIDIFLIK